MANQDIKIVVNLIPWCGEAVTSLDKEKEQITVDRDLKDNKFLKVTVTGRADVIVSEDEDLRPLHPFVGVTILPPTAFLQILNAEKEHKSTQLE